jgi:transcriptional regulator with PAS, ATPase and Fis domain
LLQNAATDTDFRHHTSVVSSQAKSVLCAPLKTAGRVKGVLYADTRSIVRPFQRQDLAFVGVVGVMLASLLHKLDTISDLRAANRALQDRLSGDELIGDSPAMAALRETLRKFAAKGDAPVLLTGDSGAGKDLAARLLHRWSARAEKPFVEVNCAAIPKDLLESELFGHVKGAFTGAHADRRGLLQLADGGVLFLDEIGELPLELQSKLLRVLEGSEFRPVGGGKVIRVDVRLIAATNRDLGAAIKAQAFRTDLFYRLNVLSVVLPPLRNHPADIPALAERFLEQLRARVNTRARRFAPEAMARLQAAAWPGNVRQLRNAVIRALYTCDGEDIQPEHLVGLEEEADEPPPSPLVDAVADEGPLAREIEALEAARIRAVLEKHRWNRSRAAAELGISRQTLLNKTKKYGV